MSGKRQKRGRRGRGGGLAAGALLLAALCLFGSTVWALYNGRDGGIVPLVYASMSAAPDRPAPSLRPSEVPLASAAPTAAPVDLAGLNSACAILERVDTGEVLAAKNADRRAAPASLTKLMTAALVLEDDPDLSGSVTLAQDIFPELYAQNASRAGFEPGETVAKKDLFYGMLLPSGAECCAALAREAAGSESAFVAEMNDKAAELGLADTHFVNTTGLDAEEHYTTAADLAALLRYALRDPAFRAAFTARSYATQATNVHPDGITFYSTMFKSLPGPAVQGGEILGGKTGYTDAAGLCLASLAEVDGVEYVLITLGAPGDHTTEQFNITDAVNVYGRLGRDY